MAVPSAAETDGRALQRAAEARLGQLPDAAEARKAREAARTREYRIGRMERRRIAENWKHKREGTPETHDRAARTRQGALARLHASGAISADQLAWAHEIAAIAELIMADANIRTASLETRIDVSRHGHAFFEALGRVRREVAYTAWRHELGRCAALVLDMIVGDIGVASAACRHRVHKRLAKRVLIDALDLWPMVLADAFKSVTETELTIAHLRIL